MISGRKPKDINNIGALLSELYHLSKLISHMANYFSYS